MYRFLKDSLILETIHDFGNNLKSAIPLNKKTFSKHHTSIINLHLGNLMFGAKIHVLKYTKPSTPVN